MYICKINMKPRKLSSIQNWLKQTGFLKLTFKGFLWPYWVSVGIFWNVNRKGTWNFNYSITKTQGKSRSQKNRKERWKRHKIKSEEIAKHCTLYRNMQYKCLIPPVRKRLIFFFCDILWNLAFCYTKKKKKKA